jgi:hypothetical protein
MRTKIKVAAAVAAAALVGGVTTTAWAGPAVPNTSSGVSTSATTVPARVFAVLNSNGTKLRGKAVASTSKIGTGIYDVRFNRNISSCAWTGTVGVGGFGGSTGPAMISVSGRAGTNNGLFVETFNGTATATDLPFTVLVVCS